MLLCAMCGQPIEPGKLYHTDNRITDPGDPADPDDTGDPGSLQTACARWAVLYSTMRQRYQLGTTFARRSQRQQRDTGAAGAAGGSMPS